MSQSYTQPSMNYPVFTQMFHPLLPAVALAKFNKGSELTGSCVWMMCEPPVISMGLQNAVHGFVSAGVFSRLF